MAANPNIKEVVDQFIVELGNKNLVIMPKSLTAENGAMDALIGEFTGLAFIECAECGTDDPDEFCEMCDGSGPKRVDVAVSWETIKEIYAAAVALFSDGER
jgi:hypothetical protein